MDRSPKVQRIAATSTLDDSCSASHIRRMWHPLASALVLVFLATVSLADEAPQGLLWNRSGLPATLPLQIKTNPGADYLLHLRDAETGQAVLAAYIRGGEFFRVLVPVGRYELDFATGTGWRGETDLFGPDTQRFELDPPLSFGATSTRKEGHLIDLRLPADITIRDLAICQRLGLDLDSLGPPEPSAGTAPLRPDTLPPGPFSFPMLHYTLRSRICD